MFSDIPHTSARWGLQQSARSQGCSSGGPAGAPPAEHLICVLRLQESYILAKTSLILIFNFIFFGGKNHFQYVKTVFSCHILRSKKGEMSLTGGPSTAPRRRTSGLARMGAS